MNLLLTYVCIYMHDVCIYSTVYYGILVSENTPSYRAAVAVGVPVALQQHELRLHTNSPVTSLFEVALHGGEAVRAGVGEEGNVAHFIVGEEVGGGG